MKRLKAICALSSFPCRRHYMLICFWYFLVVRAIKLQYLFSFAGCSHVLIHICFRVNALCINNNFGSKRLVHSYNALVIMADTLSTSNIQNDFGYSYQLKPILKTYNAYSENMSISYTNSIKILSFPARIICQKKLSELFPLREITTARGNDKLLYSNTMITDDVKFDFWNWDVLENYVWDVTLNSH